MNLLSFLQTLTNKLLLHDVYARCKYMYILYVGIKRTKISNINIQLQRMDVPLGQKKKEEKNSNTHTHTHI